MDAAADAISHSFGFAAYAADTGELRQPKNSKIVFDCGSGTDDPEKGFYSGCLFKVMGEGIKTVSATIDKGAVYRMKTVAGPTDSQDARDNGLPLCTMAPVRIWTVQTP